MTHGLTFDVLYEGDQPGERGLSDDLRTTYGSDWLIPEYSDRPYVYSNFVMSHDGRISFDVPGHEGGGDVSDFNAHDQWLMGLLRARADAVMVGAQTLRSEAEHRWTANFIFPDDSEAFTALRVAEGRRRTPWQVFVTARGDLPMDAAVMVDDELDVLVVTTETGAKQLHGHDIAVVIAGDTEGNGVDFHRAFDILFNEFGIATLECEGGPRLYGELVSRRLIDDEFLTLSPVLIGGGRPGLIEGISFAPGNPHRAHLRSLRRAGDHLFMRSGYEMVAPTDR
jgi:riboflavin biosynthesis pyrimidine reductase